MKLKKNLKVVHRWAGLATGALVFITSITGAIFVFEREIFGMLHRDLLQVEPTALPMKSASELLAIGSGALGSDLDPSWIEGFGPDRTVEVHAYHWNDSAQGLWYWDALRDWKVAYLNPYTGEVLGTLDHRFAFFTVVRQLHQNLLLRYEIGHLIVGVAVLLFLGMLMTGLALWWPRHRAALKQRLQVAWKSGRRRLQFDIHAVLGIYALPLALIIVATGLVWSFGWWGAGLNFLISGKTGDPWAEDPVVLSSPPSAEAIRLERIAARQGPIPLDLAFSEVMRRSRLGGNYWVSFPEDSTGVLQAAYQEPVKSGWVTWSGLKFDAYNGKLLHADLFADKDVRKKFRNSLYDIHVGKIYGWPTQILALLASLLCASLPVTGFLMWRGGKPRPSARDRRFRPAAHQPSADTVASVTAFATPVPSERP